LGRPLVAGPVRPQSELDSLLLVVRQFEFGRPCLEDVEAASLRLGANSRAGPSSRGERHERGDLPREEAQLLLERYPASLEETTYLWRE